MKYISCIISSILTLLLVVGGKAYCDEPEQPEFPASIPASAPMMAEKTILSYYDQYIGDQQADHEKRKNNLLRAILAMNMASTPDELMAVCRKLDLMPDLHGFKSSPEDGRASTTPVPVDKLNPSQAKNSLHWFEGGSVEFYTDPKCIHFFNKVQLPVYDRFFRKLNAVATSAEFDSPMLDHWGTYDYSSNGERTLQGCWYRVPDNPYPDRFLVTIFTLAKPEQLENLKPGDKIRVVRYCYYIPMTYCGSLKEGSTMKADSTVYIYVETKGSDFFSRIARNTIGGRHSYEGRNSFIISTFNLENDSFRVKLSADFFCNAWDGVGDDQRILSMSLVDPDPDGSRSKIRTPLDVRMAFIGINIFFACLFGGPWLMFPLIAYRLIKEFCRKLVCKAGGVEGLTGEELLPLVLKDERVRAIMNDTPDLLNHRTEYGHPELTVEKYSQVVNMHNAVLQLNDLPDKSPELISYINYMSDELRWMERRVFAGSGGLLALGTLFYLNIAYEFQEYPVFATLTVLGPVLAAISMRAPVCHFNSPIPGHLRWFKKMLLVLGAIPFVSGMVEMCTDHYVVYKDSYGQTHTKNASDNLERGATSFLVGCVMALVFLIIMCNVFFTCCAFSNYTNRHED